MQLAMSSTSISAIHSSPLDDSVVDSLIYSMIFSSSSSLGISMQIYRFDKAYWKLPVRDGEFVLVRGSRGGVP